MTKPLLLHICCGPCGMAFVKGIADEGFAPAPLWYNPNIHPYKEYENRRASAIKFADAAGLTVRTCGDYGLMEFLENVPWQEEESKCSWCYRARLEYAAKYAAKWGYGAFSTTLLASPYQDFDAICQIGAKAAQEYGLDFVTTDFRGGYRAAMDEARQTGLYMQKYCGCIFSEEERYRRRNPR